MRILIAEDDFTSRTMLQGVLTNWGYKVISTCDGEEAYAALQENDAPQLVVMDWEMPGLDGAALCRKLRSQDRKDPLYLILLTSRKDKGDLVEGLDAGADDYIPKPYDSTELRARVNVGWRMINLLNDMREREKLQGVLEMAGAVCHELNQPLQGVSGFSELLLKNIQPDDPNYTSLKNIQVGIERMGELTHRIMKITHYQSKTYLERRIVDIEQASQHKK